MKGSGPIAWIFYVAVRGVLALMQCFPLEWNLRTARVVARVWPRVLPRHRDRTVRHLTEALGDQYSAAQIGRIADRCLESVAMFAVEAICLPRLISPLTWHRYVQITNLEEAVAALLDSRGAVLVTAHYGSFEVLGHLLAAHGCDVTAIMRPQNNFYLNRFLVEGRRTHGLKLLDKKGASGGAESALREGSLVAFIGDQDAGRKGLFVDFFGKPASTYKSIGLLAMSAGVPVIVGYARRVAGRARYEVGIERVIHPHEWEHRTDPLRWITQEFTRAFERFIRADPTQYWWLHRRWKHQPSNQPSRAARQSKTVPPRT